MQTRLVAYDRLGARRGVLPDALEYSLNVNHNELGTITAHYGLGATNHEYLDDEPEIAVEAFLDNQWVELRNTRCRSLTIDRDHLEEVPTRRFDFIGVGESLKGALVYHPYGLPLNEDGKVVFSNTSAGRILWTIWKNAQSRGWTGFNYSFTPTHDSIGQPWDETLTISYEVESNLLNILQGLVAQGVADYDWDGRTLNLYKPNTVLARDLTIGPNPIRFAGSGDSSGTDSAPEMIDQGQLATHVIVLGENGLRWEFPTGTIIPEGRREVILSYSGVDDEATARILADPTIVKSQNHLKNTTRQFHLTEDTKNWPFRDYRLGDWVNVQRGIEFERMRIFAINLQVNENGIQGYVTMGDRIDDLLQRMYQRIQGLTGGVANENTGTPPKQGVREPSAPFGLIVDPSAYVDQWGGTRSSVLVTWEHNGKDTANEAISVNEYVLYYRINGTPDWIEILRTANKTATYYPLPTHREDGQVAVYDFAVKAISNGKESAFSPPVVSVMQEDGEAPPRPTTPSASTWLRTVTVTWDRMGLSPSNVVVNMPADFDFVRVWESTSSDMTSPVEVGITRSGQWNSPGIKTAGTTYYYALTAVDYTGNESDMSDSISITPQSNVDLQEIADIIDAGMLGDESIDYTKILAAEEMWTRVLGAHKIQGGEVDVNTLTADNIASGAVQTRHIGVGQVEPAGLAFGITNLLPNPSWEDDEKRAAWPMVTPYTYTQPTGVESGSWVVELNAGAAVSVLSPIDISGAIPVKPGEKYFMSWKGRRVSANVGAMFNLRVTNADGSVLVDNLYPAIMPGTATVGTWIKYEGVVQIPNNGFLIQPQLRLEGPAGTGLWEFDDLSLVTVMASTNSTGQGVEISPSGFKLYDADGRRAISLTSEPPNYMGIYDPNGTMVSSMSQDGKVMAKVLSARDQFWYKGVEMFNVLYPYPKGLVGWGAQYSNTAGTSSQLGIFEITVDLKSDRMYKLHTSPVRIYSNSPNRSFLRVRWTSSTTGTPATPGVGSPIMAQSEMLFSTADTQSTSIAKITRMDSARYRFLLCFSSESGSASTQALGSNEFPIEMWVEDIGPYTVNLQVPNPGNGTAVSAGALKQTALFQSTAFMSYKGNGAQYTGANLYQGLSPAGHGNLASMALFPTTIASTLSGSTIHRISVYLDFPHWYDNSGGTANLGVHGSTSFPATWTPPANNVVKSEAGIPKPGARWIHLPSSVFEGFKTGANRGITLQGDGTLSSYGYAQPNALIEVEFTK